MNGKLIIETELGTKKFDAQITQLKAKLNDIKATLEMGEQDKTLFSTSEMESMRVEAEKLENQIAGIETRISKTSVANKEFGNTAKASTSNMSKGLENGVGKLKRFGLALFGIHSIWRMVSRAASAYMAQDEKLTKSMQSLWVGLGAFLAPALEFISKTLLTGLGYLNEFIKALTGVDYIARANAKSLQKQSSAQKDLNKQTVGFDEANIISDKSTTTPTGAISIPELDTSVVDKLKDMAKWLKENWSTIKQVTVAVGLMIAAFKLGGIINAIAGAGGLTAGLYGVAAVLAIIVGYEIYKVIDEVKGLNKQLDHNTKLSNDNKNKTKELSKEYWEAVEAGTATTKTTEAYTKVLDNNLLSSADLILSASEQITVWGELTGSNKKLREQMEEQAETLAFSTEEYIKLNEQGKLSNEQFNSFTTTLGKTIETLEKNGSSADTLREKYFQLTGTNYGDVTIDGKLKDNVSPDLKKVLGKHYDDIKIEANLQDNVTPKKKTLWESIKTGLSSLFSFKLSGMATGGIINQPKKYYSASGSIINNPGYGTVIGGEAGREGVLPLTNSQTMAQLGQEIGKYVTIYNTIDNYMDSKRINRILAESQNKTNFAMNK